MPLLQAKFCRRGSLKLLRKSASDGSSLCAQEAQQFAPCRSCWAQGRSHEDDSHACSEPRRMRRPRSGDSRRTLQHTVARRAIRLDRQQRHAGRSPQQQSPRLLDRPGWPENNVWNNSSGEARYYNCATLRYPIGTKTDAGPGTAGMQSGWGGTNMPIQSAHPGGAMAARCDGSVSFLSESIDWITQRNLAIRDDGQVVGVP